MRELFIRLDNDKGLRPIALIRKAQMNADFLCLWGLMALSLSSAPPVSSSVGWPEGLLTTPISLKNTPRLMPVPSALAQASLAAKRLA